MKSEELVLPLLPLRGLIVYPSMVLHLDVGREKSVKALEQAMVDDNSILLSSQREVHIEDPKPEDIYKMGTIARVRQMLKLPNGTIRVLVEGLHRAKILEYLRDDDFYPGAGRADRGRGENRSPSRSLDALRPGSF